jgi:hypothetical protein
MSTTMVRRLAVLPEADAQRVAYLTQAEDDATRFGHELIRRGLF